MDLLELMQRRRSVRKYTSEMIDGENLNRILEAGLLAPSGKMMRPWEMIVIEDRKMLEQMSRCRVGSASMLTGAAAAIVVVADESRSDTWTEDSSVVMAQMHLMASSLGVGSCWIQGRLRSAENGESTESYLRSLLGFPEEYRLEAILSLGMPDHEPRPRSVGPELWKKVHRGTWMNQDEASGD